MPTPGCLIAALLTSLAVLPAVKGQEKGRGLDATLVLEVPVEGDTTVFLQRPVGATRFDNGVLAVADGMAPSVHFFDGDGRFMKSAGRAGEGPGEYSTPGWLGRCAADAATVWDFSLLRLTTVDETGAIRDQDDLRNVVDLPRPPSRMACSRTGGLMALLRLSGERVEGDDEVGVLTAPLYWFRPREDARLIDPGVRVIEWLDEERIYRPVSPTTYFTASDSLVFLAHSGTPSVEVRDLDGSLRGEWPLELERRPPTDVHVRRDAETLTAFIPSAASQAQLVDRYMGLPRPEFVPLLSGLHVDERGRVWVVTSYPGDSTTTLQAYDARGSRLMQVVIPAGIDVWEVRAGHVVGGREDPSTFEPRVLVFAFEPGG